MSEKQVERSILQYLTIKGIYCWKENNVGVFDPVKKIYRRPNSPYIIKGISDILGVLPDGRFLAIECKAKGKKWNVSKEQQSFIDAVNQNGGLAFVADKIEDVVSELKGYLR